MVCCVLYCYRALYWSPDLEAEAIENPNDRTKKKEGDSERRLKRTIERWFLWPVLITPAIKLSEDEERDHRAAVRADTSALNRAEARESADARIEASREPLIRELRTLIREEVGSEGAPTTGQGGMGVTTQETTPRSAQNSENNGEEVRPSTLKNTVDRSIKPPYDYNPLFLRMSAMEKKV